METSLVPTGDRRGALTGDRLLPWVFGLAVLAYFGFLTVQAGGNAGAPTDTAAAAACATARNVFLNRGAAGIPPVESRLYQAGISSGDSDLGDAARAVHRKATTPGQLTAAFVELGGYVDACDRITATN